MIVAGTLITPDGGSARLGEGWLRVEGRRIVEAGVGACPHTVDLGGPEHVIAPGFVDAHLHLPQFDSIGADGLPLLEWLDTVIFPAEARWEDPAYAHAMTSRVLARLVRRGTTAIAAYATVHHAGALAACAAAREMGVRAVIGQVLMDVHGPEFLIRPTAQMLREAEAYLAAPNPPHSRVEAGLNPRFALVCTMELMRGAARLAKAAGALVQTHLSETIPECARLGELFDGLDYVEVYGRAGLLGPRSVFAHGIHLSARERAELAASGSIVAHCPTANLFLQSGTMDRRATLAAGVRLALGSDIAGGPDRSMVRVARAMIEAAKAIGGPLPTAGECWWQITAGNARALGWPDAGTLDTGAAADVVVFEPDVPWRTARDPLSCLLYAWDDSWIDAVVLDGTPVAL